VAKRYLKNPTILVDPGMRRIRIYKRVLHALDNPTHILLIVDPYKRAIKIRRSEQSDPRAYHLARTLLDNNRSPEIFSKSLLRSLYMMNERWDKNQSYRIIGKASADGSEVIFNFADYTLFLGEQEWQS